MTHSEPLTFCSNLHYCAVSMESKYENLRATESDLLAHIMRNYKM